MDAGDRGVIVIDRDPFQRPGRRLIYATNRAEFFRKHPEALEALTR